MKAKRIHENIIFESPALCTRSQLVNKQGCENSKCLNGCKEVQTLMKEYYIDEGVYLIDGLTYYSIWAYKLKFMDKFQSTLNKIAIAALQGKKQNYTTYNFIFNSRSINNVDTDVLKSNFEVPFALCRRDLYKESDLPEDFREIFSEKDLDSFYDSYFELVFDHSDQYYLGLKEYNEQLHTKLFR